MSISDINQFPHQHFLPHTVIDISNELELLVLTTAQMHKSYQ